MNESTTNNASVVLEINNLKVEYRTDDGTVFALNGLDLRIEKGKSLGLVGETGAGKTTASLSILRLVPSPPGIIVDGEIKLNGENILEKTETEMDAIRGKVVSMIFQDPMTSLNPVLTVEDQIAEVIERHENVSKDQSFAKAREMLESVGISGSRGSEYPHQFSGGMKQRVVIAMALACNPNLIIADEPISALDVSVQAQVINLLDDLKSEFGLTILFIAHNLSVVKYFSDRIGVMYFGKIVEIGESDTIYNNPVHPYTRALLSAVPQPNPILEKKREIIFYDPKMHNYTVERPILQEIVDGHYVLCSDSELIEYKKQYQKA